MQDVVQGVAGAPPGATPANFLGAPAKAGWLGDEDILQLLHLREWGTDTVHALPTPERTDHVIGRGATATLQLNDPFDLVSRRHARLHYDAGWWIEDLGSTHGTYRDSERNPRFLLDAGVEIGLGTLTLIAETPRLVALRRYLARIIGWSPERRPAIDLALRALRAAAHQRATIELAGADDLVAVARQLHLRTKGASAPFVVCAPKSAESDKRLRVTATEPDANAAFLLATGGTVCVRMDRRPRDFAWLETVAVHPRATVQLVVCTQRASLPSTGVVSIAVPALASRSEHELDRVITEYTDDSIAELGPPWGTLGEPQRACVARRDADSFEGIETSTLRFVALSHAGNPNRAAARLGMTREGLDKWLKRRPHA